MVASWCQLVGRECHRVVLRLERSFSSLEALEGASSRSGEGEVFGEKLLEILELAEEMPGGVSERVAKQRYHWF